MDNISPAVPMKSEKTWNELSPQEFQQMLSAWFQEKGVVQDMKSYLKFQMVNVLKNTAIGKSIRNSASQTYTLAQQALHLIVAEYLLYFQCHFALSLFSTEVNLANVLPEAKLLFDPQNLAKETVSKFDKENLVNILELVGIPKGSQYFSLVFNEYFNGNGTSLLHCLLGLVTKGSDQPMEDDELKVDMDFENDDLMKNVHHLLQSANLPIKTQSHLLHNLKTCCDSKFRTYETQVFQLVNKFKKELHSHEQKLHRAQSRRKALEKRLFKLQNENQMLRDEKLIYSERIVEKPVVSMPCTLCHCNEECSNAKRQCDLFRKDIERLQSINTKQTEEIERLSSNYNDLLKEFNNCQSKISLVSSRLQEEVICDQASKDRGSSLSLSSGSLTEEILNEARRKLKLLEEESEELDIRFNQFVIK